MKRKFFIILGVVFITCCLNGFALATPTPGNYTLPEIKNASWIEFYGPGGPGQPGNSLHASEYDPTSYRLRSFILESVTPLDYKIDDDWNLGEGYQEYITTYINGTVLLEDNAGLWGDGVNVTGLSATNYTRNYDNGDILFYFNSFFQDNGLNYHVYAGFAGHLAPVPTINPVTYYGSYWQFESTDDFWQQGGYGAPGHAGYGFYELGIDISPVPEPATMLLFGSGLLGLAGLRRKFKK